MAGTTHVYAGASATMGANRSGIFRQVAGDNHWDHLTNGIPGDAGVHAITVHPTDSETVFAGTTKGLYRSSDHGNSWKRLALPNPEADIWSV